MSALTLGLISVALVERTVNALAFVVVYLACRSPSKGKSKGGMQALAGLTGSGMQAGASVVQTLASLAVGVAGYAVVAAVGLCVCGVMWLLLRNWALWAFQLTGAYNGGLGTSLQVLVVWPAKILGLVLEQLVPLWNSVWWIWRKIPTEILVNWLATEYGHLMQIPVELGKASGAAVMSMVSWIASFNCCTEGLLCNQQCYEAGSRVFDFLTPMSHLRQMMVHVAFLMRGMCSVMSGPVDMLVYPFMDINFAEGLHFLGNALLYSVTHLPAITYQRCEAFRTESDVMCVPDFAPVFTMATHGLRSFGKGLDNWFDILVIIVRSSLGYSPPACTQLPDLLRDFDFQAAAFGTNATAMVGLTKLMFARTDGLGVQYFSTARSWQQKFKAEAFPFQTDAGYGFAAISHYPNADHDPDGDDTMALLGCGCEDSSTGLKITCGVAMFGGDQVRSLRL